MSKIRVAGINLEYLYKLCNYVAIKLVATIAKPVIYYIIFSTTYEYT